MDILHIKEKMKNVPFGNSQFQILHFTAGQETPERRYRNVLLQLHQKLNAMQECSFRRKRRELDIAEAKEKLKTAEGVQAERYKVDIEEAEYYLGNEIKLIEDCAIEIATYSAILEKLPDFSREDFEKKERLYWEVRLLKDAQREIFITGNVDKGTMQSLEDIGLFVKRNNDGQLVIEGELESQKMIEAKED